MNTNTEQELIDTINQQRFCPDKFPNWQSGKTFQSNYDFVMGLPMSNNPEHTSEEFVIQMDGGVFITMVVDGDDLVYWEWEYDEDSYVHLLDSYIIPLCY